MKNSMLVGTRKGLFRIKRNSSDLWTITQSWFLGDPVSMLLEDSRSNKLYAALDLGHFGVKLHRTDDAGISWNEIPAPAFPPKPENEEDKDPMRGLDLPWTTKLIWSLETGGEPGELWCGVIPGGLFHSIDGGDNWDLIRSLWDDPQRKKWMGGGYDFAGIHSILVDPRDANHITVGVSVGGIWTSKDRGGHWQLIGSGLRNAYMPADMAGDPIAQDAHRVVQCPAAPDRLWMQHHNGIFRSDDGGENWQELYDVPPSSFGFAVAVHPEQPDCAWFIPATKDEQRIPVDARLVLSRTRDAGKTFEILHQGLADEPAYDLVYRHALDIADNGQQLAFGSTTGSLWVSDDQGDTWQSISKHLPPILCVRFEQ